MRLRRQTGGELSSSSMFVSRDGCGSSLSTSEARILRERDKVPAGALGPVQSDKGFGMDMRLLWLPRGVPEDVSSV